MKRLRVRFAQLVLALFVIRGAAASWAQMGCSRSAADPRYLRYGNDPEVVVLAIDVNLRGDETSSTGVNKARRVLQSLRGAGRSKTLDGGRVAEALRADNFAVTPHAGEILEFLGGYTPFNRPAELRITSATLRALSPSPVDAATLLGHTLGPLLQDRPMPMITFEKGCPVGAALAFRKALREQKLEAAVGVSTAIPPDPSVGNLDYVIVMPQEFSPPFRDQAAVSYARSFLPEMPVIFDVAEPQFYAECFWLATGAAGLRYKRAVNFVNLELSDLEIAHLRGVCVLVDSVRGRPLVFSPTGKGNGAPTAFLARGLPLRLTLFPPSRRFEWRLDLPGGVYNVYPFHYDAHADVFVEEGARYKQREVCEFSYKLPPTVVGFWGCVVIPSAEDRQTTMGPVTPLDGEILEDTLQ